MQIYVNMDIDEVDIYNDLDEFEQEQDKKSKVLLAAEEKHKEAQEEITRLNNENNELRKKLKVMESNFKKLLDAANDEVSKKNQLINELRKEKDDICFRRKQAPPHSLRGELYSAKAETSTSSSSSSALNYIGDKQKERQSNRETLSSKKEYDDRQYSKERHHTSRNPFQKESHRRNHYPKEKYAESESNLHKPADLNKKNPFKDTEGPYHNDLLNNSKLFTTTQTQNSKSSRESTEDDNSSRKKAFTERSHAERKLVDKPTSEEMQISNISVAKLKDSAQETSRPQAGQVNVNMCPSIEPNDVTTSEGDGVTLEEVNFKQNNTAELISSVTKPMRCKSPVELPMQCIADSQTEDLECEFNTFKNNVTSNKFSEEDENLNALAEVKDQSNDITVESSIVSRNRCTDGKDPHNFPTAMVPSGNHSERNNGKENVDTSENEAHHGILSQKNDTNSSQCLLTGEKNVNIQDIESIGTSNRNETLEDYTTKHKATHPEEGNPNSLLPTIVETNSEKDGPIEVCTELPTNIISVDISLTDGTSECDTKESRDVQDNILDVQSSEEAGASYKTLKTEPDCKNEASSTNQIPSRDSESKNQCSSKQNDDSQSKQSPQKYVKKNIQKVNTNCSSHAAVTQSDALSQIKSFTKSYKIPRKKRDTDQQPPSGDSDLKDTTKNTSEIFTEYKKCEELLGILHGNVEKNSTAASNLKGIAIDVTESQPLQKRIKIVDNRTVEDVEKASQSDSSLESGELVSDDNTESAIIDRGNIANTLSVDEPVLNDSFPSCKSVDVSISNTESAKVDGENCPNAVSVDEPVLNDSLSSCKSVDVSIEAKKVSLGSSDYVFEKVSENVVSVFITRKRGKKRRQNNS